MIKNLQKLSHSTVFQNVNFKNFLQPMVNINDHRITKIVIRTLPPWHVLYLFGHYLSPYGLGKSCLIIMITMIVNNHIPLKSFSYWFHYMHIIYFWNGRKILGMSWNLWFLSLKNDYFFRMSWKCPGNQPIDVLK